MSRSLLPAVLALASLANVSTGEGSLQGHYWKVKPIQGPADPIKKRARKAQKQARKANRSR